MKHFISLSALLVLIASPVCLETSAAAQTAANRHQEMVKTYCVTCHSTRAKMGGLALEGLNLQAAADNAEIWEKALRKLRGNQMPPPGSPQPPQKDVESFVAWMENTLDTNAKGPKAGYLPIQRLNRTEYAASVKALVGVDVNPKEVLPQDIQVEGFDNIADALSVSPAFLDQYVTAARHIAQIAVGNPNPRVSSVKYPIDANQNPDDPPPLGTWGGMKFKHSFPADGEYQITLTNLAVGPYSNALERENTVVILIDGRTVFRKSIGGAADLSLVDRTAGTGRSQVMDRFSKIPVQVKAGVRDVVVAFVDRPHVETSENLATASTLRRIDRRRGAHRPQASSSRRRRGCRTVQSYRRVDDSQPRPDLRVRSQEDWRAGLRQTDHGTPGAPRIPAAGHHGRCEPARAVL